MLFQYWPTANSAGPTLKQHRVKSSSLQGELSAFGYTRAVCVWLEQATHSRHRLPVPPPKRSVRQVPRRLYLATQSSV